jgi:hypothetical protein
MKMLLTACFVSVLLVALAAHPYAPTIALILLSAWSLGGAKQAIQALSLVVLIKFLNPAIYQFEGPLALWAWIAPAVAGLRIFVENLRIKSKRHPVIPWLLLFSSMVFLSSLFFSHHSVVSIFKVMSFTFVSAAILIGFKVTASRSVDWTPWFLGLWIGVVALSAPTLLFPDIGFRTNGTGFQGILNHPQTFGVFLAPMVAWLTGTLLFTPSKRAYWLYVATPAAWTFLFLTAARTALIAVVAGFVVILFVALLNRPQWRKSIRKGVLRPASALLAFAILSLFLLEPSLLAETVYRFVRKGDSQATVAESFESSRGRGIAGQWLTFNAYPVFGIGFGVSLDSSFKPIMDPFTGLPLSAPVEKGFLPTAVLEETGIFGAIFFIPFLFSLITHVFSKTEIVLPWVFLASLFVNTGEMIFFSVGGLGLYTWLLMGWATCPRWEKKGAA